MVRRTVANWLIIVGDRMMYERELTGAGIAVALSNPTTRKALGGAAYQLGRGLTVTAARTGYAAAAPFVAGAGPYAAAVAGGYMIGAGVGTAISQQIWGDRGGDLAWEFYTDVAPRFLFDVATSVMAEVLQE